MEQNPSNSIENSNSVKYPHPKILLIDIADDVASILQHSGYNIAEGSLGSPYAVIQNNSFNALNVNGLALPNYKEQEIIILDMVVEGASTELEDEETIITGKNYHWVSCAEGTIDPRPYTSFQVQSDFERIYQHGGIFVIFCAPSINLSTIWGHTADHHKRIERLKDYNYTNYDLLSILAAVTVSEDWGEEISISIGQGSLNALLQRHSQGATFSCTFKPLPYINEIWAPLAVNKYRAPVAGVIHHENAGYIFLLPALTDKGQFIDSLLKEYLPDISPKLFPSVIGKWTEKSEYELPKVLEHQAKLDAYIDEANKHIALIEQEIEHERGTQGFLHDLITETGTALVVAVKKTLEIIGFHSVVNIDDEKVTAGDTGPQREDLRINDGLPIVLVEVKGISNLPKEASSLQVWKYLAPRMRELGHTQIHGLSIINHQRNLPGLERENKSPFQEDIIINAQDQDFTVMTAWDLFRLTRSFLQNNWIHENVKPLFYSKGRIDPVPTHYEYIGRVEDYFEKIAVVGIRIEEHELLATDRIAFDLPVHFEEQAITSLEYERQVIERAEIGMLAGTKTHLSKQQARKGTRVFRIKTG